MMTKEDILEAVALDIFSLEQILDEFFNSNVIIPRGENRHPHADVLHEWIEGAEIVASEDRKHNHDVSSAKSKLSGTYYLKKCIKPSEIVYEFMYYDSEGKTDWLTEDEYKLMMDSEPMECYKVVETKRVRV